MKQPSSKIMFDTADARQVLDALADAVIVVDLSYRILWVNKAFTVLSDIPRDSAVGKPCHEVFPGLSCNTPDCPMTRIMNGEESVRYEADKRCGFDTCSPGIISASPFLNVDGSLAGIIEVVSHKTPLHESRERFRKAMGGVIQAMSLTIEKRDNYTASHQRRVTKLCRAMAGELGFSWERTQGLRMASAIHDLGKILIPAAILNKSGELSPNEMGIIRDHPKTAYDILKDIDFPWPIAETIYQHHERMDGSGYPQGLNGDEILLEARILAVADVYDAITCFRSYRPAVGQDTALSELKTNRGVLYDADVVDALACVLEKGAVALDFPVA